MSTDLLNVWDRVKKIAALKDAALQDKAVPVFPNAVAKESVDASPSIPLRESTSLRLKTNCSAELVVFPPPNLAGGADPDGILRATDPHPEPLAAPPIIDIASAPSAQYWVKYAIEGLLDQATTIPLGGTASLGFHASEDLRFCDYRLHPKASILGECVRQDMVGCRMALAQVDIQALEPGEAISLRMRASLCGSTTIHWADVFTEAMGWLGASIGTAGGLGLEVSLGATFSATITMADDFRIVFAGVKGGEIRVAISKARSRTEGLNAALGLIVDVDWTAARIQALLVDCLGDTYTKLPSKVQAKISDALLVRAKQKVAAGFTYEYSRIATDSVLFQVVMEKAALTEERRGAFLRADLKDVLAEVQSGSPGIRLEQYLRKNDLKVEHAWGFSLGFMHWKLIGQDRCTFNRETTLDIEDRKKVAYCALRAYSSNDREWSFECRADMDHFCATPSVEPALAEFGFGFHVLMALGGKVKKSVIPAWLEWAALWRVVDGAAAERLEQDLNGLSGRRVRMTLQILVDESAAKEILDFGRKADFPGFSSAMAAALPWVPKVPGRSDPKVRRETYGPIWDTYFSSERGLDDDPGNTVEAWLRVHGQHDPTLLGWEREAPSEDTFKEVVGVIDNGAPWSGMRTIKDRVRAFTASLKTLSRRQETPANQLVPDVLTAMTGMGSQYILTRALGIYLLDLADACGILAETARSLTIHTETGAEKKVLVFGSGERNGSP